MRDRERKGREVGRKRESERARERERERKRKRKREKERESERERERDLEGEAPACQNIPSTDREETYVKANETWNVKLQRVMSL